MVKTDIIMRNSVTDFGLLELSPKAFIQQPKSENEMAMNIEPINNPEGVWLLELTDYRFESKT